MPFENVCKGYNTPTRSDAALSTSIGTLPDVCSTIPSICGKRSATPATAESPTHIIQKSAEVSTSESSVIAIAPTEPARLSAFAAVREHT